MPEHLGFILAAPLAAFGGPAGHERRPSSVLPGRSALLGLLGAALGVEPGDGTGQAELGRFGFAVQSLRQSRPLRDFHTVQTIPSGAANGPASRRDALEQAGYRTRNVVTHRDYRCDVAIAAVVWGGGLWSLNRLAEALRRPEYALCLGRRACPLAWPLGPELLEAANPVRALAGLRPGLEPGTAGAWEVQERSEVMSWSEIPGLAPVRVEEAHTKPGSRRRWTFRPEQVWIYPSCS